MADLDAPLTGALPDALAAGVLPADVSVVVCAYTLDRWADLEQFTTRLREAGKRVELTFFLSAVTLIADADRRSYAGPHQAPGRSKIGFGLGTSCSRAASTSAWRMRSTRLSSEGSERSQA